jgi:phosphatidylserine decarboxylase
VGLFLPYKIIDNWKVPGSPGPQSSTDNERHSIVYKVNGAEILVKQITGAVALRIVNYLKPSMQVKQGEEMGFIKLGSRVDVMLPVGTKVKVKLNEVVQGSYRCLLNGN